MSKHSFTPGPWEITETLGQMAITIPHKKIGIAFDIVCHISGNIRKGNPEANAHLIASAPELLEACKSIRHLLYLLEGKISTTKLAMFIQAIAKAEGGKK